MDKVHQFLEKHNTMTLATVGEKGASAAAVFYAFSKKKNTLIFISSPESEHIKNIKKNDKCAATINDDGLDWEIIKGLQIKGRAKNANDDDWKSYFDRFPFVKKDKKLNSYLEKVNLYAFKIEWIRIIDNKEELGNNIELKY